MKAKDLKEMLNAIPDEAWVTIDGNDNVDIVGFSMEISNQITANLEITEGFSITCDKVVDLLFDDLKRRSR